MELILQDDGYGFDPSATSKGNGLANISNRANRIGARLEFKSKPGSGTTLALYLKV